MAYDWRSKQTTSERKETRVGLNAQPVLNQGSVAPGQILSIVLFLLMAAWDKSDERVLASNVRERGFEPPDSCETELPIPITRTLSPAPLAWLSYSRGAVIPAGALNRFRPQNLANTSSSFVSPFSTWRSYLTLINGLLAFRTLFRSIGVPDTTTSHVAAFIVSWRSLTWWLP